MEDLQPPTMTNRTLMFLYVAKTLEKSCLGSKWAYQRRTDLVRLKAKPFLINIELPNSL